MTTMSDLVDAALAEVYGYTATVDSSTYLTDDLPADGQVVAVADASTFSRGIVQIGDELMIVDSVDRSAGLLALGSLRGRGVRGTTAAGHAIGDRVTMSPSIPRFQAVNAVNETLRSSSGLFAVASVQVTYDPDICAYELPEPAKFVLDVSWLPSLGGRWLPMRQWSHDKYRQAVSVGPGGVGRPIQVTYAKEPTVPPQSADFSETGLPDSCIDVIRFGAAWRISAFLEPVSLMSQSAESDALKRGAYPTSRIKVSTFYLQLYQQRLSEEVRGLQDATPMRSHWATA